MDYKLLFWVGIAIVLGIVIKLISSRSDAKPDEWTNAKSATKTSTRTEPASRRFDDGATKSAPRFDANQKKTTVKRPATTFSSEIGSGGRFPIGSVTRYKILLYIIHFIVYFFCTLYSGGFVVIIGFLLYKLVVAYNKNANLESLSPTEQQNFIHYAQSIQGLGYLFRIAIPMYILQSILTVIIAFISVMLFLGNDLADIVNLIP